MKLESAIESQQERLAATRKELRDRAGSMIRVMETLIRKLDSDDPSVSSTGEVQSRGSFIDVLCAQHEAERAALRMLRNLKVTP